MRFSILLPALFSVVGFVSAEDFRLLYTIPSDETMVDFTVAFGNACATWAPALSAGLTFQEFLVEPGNFSGANPDTEAKIFCIFTSGSGPAEAFTTDVAASVGATETSD